MVASTRSAPEPSAALPRRLARLHDAGPAGTIVDASVAGVPGAHLRRLLAGAGLERARLTAAGRSTRVRAVRGRTLADVVGPGMSLLVCGLNPSLYSADAGVGYARPGNRFWPAALAAGLVTADRDAWGALADHGVGFTDLVKRATVRADELRTGEFRAGAERVARLVAWLRPGAVCFVGLAGWRAAIDRRAVPGLQPAPFGGRPAYVMPSTSGLNAHSSLAELAAHLRAAADLAAEAVTGCRG